MCMRMFSMYTCKYVCAKFNTNEWRTVTAMLTCRLKDSSDISLSLIVDVNTR